MALLATESGLFGIGDHWDDSGPIAALLAEQLGTELTLALLLEFIPALGTHFGRLFASFGHELTRCKLRVNG